MPVISRPKLVLAFALFAGLNALAQTTALSYRPVTADYSRTLDRLIIVSGNPNALHIYDPVANNDVKVNLQQPPISLSVSPDGLHAAVGHDSLISYVNLQTASVEKTYAVSGVVNSIVATPEWLYVLPGQFVGNVLSVNIGSGNVTTNSSLFYSGKGWFNSLTNSIYGTRGGSPDDVVRLTISTGPVTSTSDSPYHGDYCVTGRVWFSTDGTRIYTGCGTIFRASTDTTLDMRYVSSIPGYYQASSLGAFAESTPLHLLATIPTKPTAFNSSVVPDESKVLLFDSSYLQAAGQFPLSDFNVNGNNYSPHGRFAFFNAASTELWVVKQADTNSGLLNDYAVQRFVLGNGSQCGMVLSSSFANVTGATASGSVNITAPASCVYQATTSVPWITIPAGAYGVGSGTLTWQVSANTDSIHRTGIVSVGGKSFTITQEPLTTSSSTLFVPGYYAVDAAYSKPLDRLILVSSNPSRLRIYDPNAQTEQVVALSANPLSVSVRPDGLQAAVGHDGWVSIVDLVSATVQKVTSVPTDVHTLIYASNGYAYLFPSRDWSDIYSLAIASGTISATSAIYNGREPRLHVNGKNIYVGGTYQSKWDISQGVIKSATTQFLGQTCGKIWLTEDGARLINACSKVYTTSDVPDLDLKPNGTLSNTSGVTWADESSQKNLTAVIPASTTLPFPSGSKSVDDTVVQLYTYATLGYQGGLPIPKFQTGAGESYPSHGRFVFWSKSGSTLYVVAQVDSKAMVPGGTGIIRLAPEDARQVTVNAIQHSASQIQTRISPGEIISMYGTGLGPAKGVNFGWDPLTGKAPTNLSGTEVYIYGIAAPVIYASDTQINAIVPFEIPTAGDVPVQVAYQGLLMPPIAMTAAAAIPGIFTTDNSGKGQAAALNLDSTLADAAHPVAPGDYVQMFLTGGGITSPRGQTGARVGTTFERLTQPVSATVGGVPAVVQFAGSAPLLIEGAVQVNLRLDKNTPSGPAQPVIITIGNNSTQATATIAVK